MQLLCLIRKKNLLLGSTNSKILSCTYLSDNATMRKVEKTIYFEQERLSDMLNDMCLAVKIMTVLSN